MSELSESKVSARPATPDDIPIIMELIMELAVYEKEEAQVKITAEQLLRDGFGEQPRFHCLIGLLDGKPVAYSLYFFIYSTWEVSFFFIFPIF